MKTIDEKREYDKKRMKIWRENNIERSREISRNYARRNREKLKLYKKIHKEQNSLSCKKYYLKHRSEILSRQKISSKKYYKLNRDKLIIKSREWVINNREKERLKMQRWKKRKRETDIFYKISWNMSSAIYKALLGIGKSDKWFKLVGYNVDDLKLHLEKQFKDGMNWENYGKWHIDHKKPKSWFKITSDKCDEFKQCWSLNNLQPLWAHDNIIKRDRWEDK